MSNSVAMFGSMRWIVAISMTADYQRGLGRP